ncbi:unnamed protein product [Sympodiomycopsis kandeliae]
MTTPTTITIITRSLNRIEAQPVVPWTEVPFSPQMIRALPALKHRPSATIDSNIRRAFANMLVIQDEDDTPNNDADNDTGLGEMASLDLIKLKL